MLRLRGKTEPNFYNVTVKVLATQIPKINVHLK